MPTRSASSPSPSASATAAAASEFWTLCRPNIGKYRSGDRPPALGRCIGNNDVKAGPVTPEPQINGADIGLRAHPVGQNPAIRQFWDHRLHDRMINAQCREPVERNVADKGLERLAQRVETAEKIEMLGIDIGDDRAGRRQPGEACRRSRRPRPPSSRRRRAGYWCRTR